MRRSSVTPPTTQPLWIHSNACSWRCAGRRFESAGYDPASYPGKVGVLSSGGGVVSSYLLAKLHHADLPGQTASTSHINNDKDFLSTRVSFKLNLRGPSFTYLVRVLLVRGRGSSGVPDPESQRVQYDAGRGFGGACASSPWILSGQAEPSFVGRALPPFNSVGHGTIFGSGVGAVLLKPLEQAMSDRDHIFAVIKGTAANNDGSTKSSYTAPVWASPAR